MNEEIEVLVLDEPEDYASPNQEPFVKMDAAYEAWVLQNSTPSMVRAMAQRIVDTFLDGLAEDKNHRHLFLGRPFRVALGAALTDALYPWSEEVAGMRVAVGAAQEFQA